MITGAHVVIHTRDAEADRAFLRDVLGWSHVDAGHGWLIFAAPPAEVACHPTGGEPAHELMLMCDDLDATAAELAAQGVEFS
ncbi:VOC family protein, partial [Streptomyces carpinensis]